MLQLNIKPKAIPQGYLKPDVTAEILQIHSVIPVELDSKAYIHVSLCTAQKREIYNEVTEYVTETVTKLNENGEEITEQVTTEIKKQVASGTFEISGVGVEVHSQQLEYVNPDYAGWISDNDLVAFVCAALQVELL